MSMVSAPSDRRFRRAHVKPGRARRSWRTFAWPIARGTLVLALLVLAGWRATGAVAHARVLQISRIVVVGNERLSSGEVLAVLEGLTGRSLLWTDLDEWRRRLLSSPWVRDAALRRSLPSTVEVAVVERQPVGIGRIHGAMYLVDERGVVIDEYGPKYQDLDLPIVDGLVAPGPAADAAVDEGRAELAARVIASVKAKPEVAKRVSQIDVGDLHDVTVILEGDAAVLHLGDEQFAARLENYIGLAPTLRERVAEIDYVDLRFDDRIYVRPAGKPPKAPHVALTAGGGHPATATRAGRPAAAPQAKATKQ